MNNCCICWFFTHILTKCTIQKTKSQLKISSSSVAQRDLIPALKGYFSNIAVYFQISHYTAAVVEYGAVGNISIHGPQVLLMNANNYVDYVTQAASSVSDVTCSRLATDSFCLFN
jgi:hypothetical protein